MDSKLACIVVCALAGLCDSAFVETLGKCSYKDGKCVGRLIELIVKEVSDKGIPELDMPSMDPADLANTSIPVADFFNIIIEEGKAKGFKTCVVGSMHNDLDKGVTNMDLTCDITVSAKIKVDGSTPFAQSLFGQDSFNGNGNIKLKLEKVKLKTQFFYHLIEKDGDIYFNYHEDEIKSDYEIENFKLSIKNLIINKQDVSEVLENFCNQNWKIIMPTFGRPFVDVGMNIVSSIVNKWFTKVPAKNYYTDDLASFVKN